MPPSPTAAARKLPRSSATGSEAPPRLRAVIGKLYRLVNASGRGSGLTSSQLSALGSIARQGPLRLTDLAESESLNPTMLSRIVAALDEAGLVRRVTDSQDRRSVRVEVTAAGRRTHDRLRAERATVLAEGLDRLTAAERRSVEAAIPALETLVEAICR